MIVIDKNEANQGNKLPIEQNYQLNTILEDYTGADILVSPNSFPCTTEKLIDKHLEQGAVLIQRKSGLDIIKSSQDHISGALCKMVKRTLSYAQRVLLVTGHFDVSVNGELTLNDLILDFSYIDFISILSKWSDRGGVVVQLCSDGMISSYLKMKEKHLIDYAEHGIKYTIPSVELQKLSCITDWRQTLATFPLIGIERSNEIQQSLIKNGRDNCLLAALIMLTDSKRGVKLSGIGKSIYQKSRDWLGLPHGWDLDIKPGEFE